MLFLVGIQKLNIDYFFFHSKLTFVAQHIVKYQERNEQHRNIKRK